MAAISRWPSPSTDVSDWTQSETRRRRAAMLEFPRKAQAQWAVAAKVARPSRWLARAKTVVFRVPRLGAVGQSGTDRVQVRRPAVGPFASGASAARPVRAAPGMHAPSVLTPPSLPSHSQSLHLNTSPHHDCTNEGVSALAHPLSNSGVTPSFPLTPSVSWLRGRERETRGCFWCWIRNGVDGAQASELLENGGSNRSLHLPSEWPENTPDQGAYFRAYSRASSRAVSRQ